MSKPLVAYFSASGVTATLSQKLAAAIGAELFEIVPEKKYTDEDLDWQNDKSRSSIEMQDKSSRPGISAKKDNMADYDVIFVGFPIWWYREPSIIDTFMESYDFTGKTVIPFATSGGSDIEESAKNMQEIAKRAKIVHGKRFENDASEDELRSWAQEWL